MTGAREESGIASLIPILEREARKLAYGNNFSSDDLFQEGVIAAIAAMKSYDPGRGSLHGYIRTCARNSMISYLRRNGHESPMDEEILSERIMSDESRAGNSDEPQEIMERREALHMLLTRLSEFETEVFYAYLKSGSISGAVGMLGCERKKADNALQRIRQKARAMER
jgi:RNA polymerase sporulation-specific sigma factor